MFSIGQAYSNDFAEVTKTLTELGTPPRVAVDPTFTIANAVPTDSKLASKDDVKENTAAVKDPGAKLDKIVNSSAATVDASSEGAARLSPCSRHCRGGLEGLYGEMRAWSNALQTQLASRRA